jgi:hypothetical protein
MGALAFAVHELDLPDEEDAAGEGEGSGEEGGGDGAADAQGASAQPNAGRFDEYLALVRGQEAPAEGV